jgi:hypothetical protein
LNSLAGNARVLSLRRAQSIPRPNLSIRMATSLPRAHESKRSRVTKLLA